MGEWYAVSLGEPVPILIWLGFWLATGETSDAARDAFIACFLLEEQEITEPPSLDPLPVIAFTNSAFWLQAVAYILSPSGACLEGCLRTVFD